MPNYEYDKDYPFAAFITNLGKYNEGELVGEWVKFPTTADEMKKVFERIGVGQADEFGCVYEEWFVTDYDCYVDGLYDKLGEYVNLDELNYLASRLDEMTPSEYEQFQAAIEMGEHTRSLEDLINLTYNLDCYDVYPGIHDHDDLGRYYIEELGAMEIPSYLESYFDYEAYGRDVALEEGGEFTDFGYVRDTGDRFYEEYDGQIESIPEEYRVMNFEDEEPELTMDDKMDMATDLAFDLDEFFRQHDPQYAAQHPEPHEQKELIADLLLDGKTAALREMLEEMAQTGDDVLPGRIAEYERETGYDPKQDTSIAEDKAKLTLRPEQPDDHLTGERIQTPRGSFALTDLSKEQMEAAGYGVHHQSDNRQFLIMGNGTRAFAVANAEMQERDNPLKTAEMTVEDDYAMIDGQINNGRRDEVKEKPSIRERLAEAKRECAERPTPEKAREGRGTPEHGSL
ncbi:MAG: antirestriction protein ArdA [Eubacteriales bacterium]